jgi:hypothetical protein
MTTVYKLLLLSVVWSITACAGTTVYTVKTNGITAPGAQSSSPTYVLFSANPGIKVTDLEFIEYVDYIDSALKSRGFTKVHDLSEASLVIGVSYGIGDPESSTQSSSYTYTPPKKDDDGNKPTGFWDGFAKGIGSTSSKHTSTTTTTTYHRFLVLEAFDCQVSNQKNQLVPVWKNTVASRGTTGDLRVVFPYLVAASVDYLGKNTKKEITVSIRAGDPTVKSLRK